MSSDQPDSGRPSLFPLRDDASFSASQPTPSISPPAPLAVSVNVSPLTTTVPTSSTQAAQPPLTSLGPVPEPLLISETNGIRRSGRAVIPSKRSEKLNQIGDSITQSVPPPGKENIPPMSTGPPPWVSLAKGHFLTRDLGEDWTACVSAWFSLEEKLGFGRASGTKVRNINLIT